jgi:NAD(P)-dependent dehydrogenase (short-subunit alcohol dehydrogenase family)
MNERNVAIVRGGPAGIGPEICRHMLALGLATKAGIISMTRTWALELTAVGITANVVASDPIAGAQKFSCVIPKASSREETLANAIAVKRLERSGDVARTVVFFADREKRYVTAKRPTFAAARL